MSKRPVRLTSEDFPGRFPSDNGCYPEEFPNMNFNKPTMSKLRAIFIAVLINVLVPALAFAEDAKADSLDATINKFFGDFTGPFVGLIFYSVDFAGTSFPLIVGWLVIAATIFTIYFGLIQVRGFKHAIDLVKGDYSNPDDKGEVSHFQALATALSGTVGLR